LLDGVALEQGAKRDENELEPGGFFVFHEKQIEVR
jgi:hypothetical protein